MATDSIYICPFLLCMALFILFIFFVALDANILVQQSCPCVSPFRCKCSSPGGVTYVLADLDLLCLDGRSVSGKYVEWTEAKLHEPAGTCGMKASEVRLQSVLYTCFMHQNLLYIAIFYWQRWRAMWQPEVRHLGRMFSNDECICGKRRL